MLHPKGSKGLIEKNFFICPLREVLEKCFLGLKSGEPQQQSAAQSARKMELEGISGDSEVLPVPRFLNAEGETSAFST